MNKPHGVAWCIGGTAGEGLESAGEIFAQSLAKAGQAPTTQRDFPSRIRGGDTTFTVRLTPEGLLAPPAHLDIALMFNETVLPRLKPRLRVDSLLLVDDGIAANFECNVATIPFTQLAVAAGDKRAKNMVALGASATILGASPEPILAAIKTRFKSKGEAMVETNLAAFAAGKKAAAEFAHRFPLPAPKKQPAWFMSGNQALSIGALDAGLSVAAAYPITPASDILEFLTPRLTKRGGIAMQMEDEMAALNVCIGAGFTGQRAITATSGPGLSLMTETLGLAESTETPVVIIDCQRPGPSTGMPTKHAQDDLWHLAHGGHGEAVRIALAPIDVGDAHRTAVQAFDLADKYHCPVLIAMDQQLSLMKQTVSALATRPEKMVARPNGPAADAWDGSYLPYGDSGESPKSRGRPGEKWGMHLSNSTEHGPSGLTTEDPAMRNAMVERRLARMEAIATTTENAVVVTGEAGAETVVIACGSTAGACLEAAARSSAALRVIALRLLWPMPVAALQAAIGDASNIIIAEANGWGQLASLIKSELPIHEKLVSVRRYDGIPLTSDNILEVLD